MLKKLGSLWCTTFHTNVTLPIRGEYWCRVCGRRYQVCWAFEERSLQSRSEAAKFSFQNVQAGWKWVSSASGESRRSLLVDALRRVYVRISRGLVEQ